MLPSLFASSYVVARILSFSFRFGVSIALVYAKPHPALNLWGRVKSLLGFS